MRKYFLIDYRPGKPVLAYDTLRNLIRKFGPKLANGKPVYDIEKTKIFKYNEHDQYTVVCERTTQRATEEALIYMNAEETARQSIYLTSWALIDDLDDLLAEPDTAALGLDLLRQFRNALWSEPKDPLQ